MPGHHHHARIKQRALRAPQTVGQPTAQNGGKVNAAAVSADDTARHRLIDAQAAFAGLVIQINQQDALHAVKRKALPQLNLKQRGKLPRMPEKLAFAL